MTWSVRGEQGKSGLLAGEPLLHLHVQANPLVICQRCNAPFAYPVDSQTLLHLVKSEDDLDDGFSASGQETARTTKTMTAKKDKVLRPINPKGGGAHHFDLLAQIEDELILSVPYVPKHDVCPGAQANDGDASQEPVVKRPSPFAVLEQLKHKD